MISPPLPRFDDSVVISSASIPRYSSEQPFSTEATKKSLANHPTTRQPTQPSVPSFEAIRTEQPPEGAGPLTGLPSPFSERKGRQKYASTAERLGGIPRVKVTIPRSPGRDYVSPPQSPQRPSSRSMSPAPQHPSVYMQAAKGDDAPNDANPASGVAGHTLPPSSPSQRPTSRQHANPLDMPMLWPQPPPGLSGTASPPIAVALLGGGPPASTQPPSNLDDPLEPLVRSYVTYGGGKFTSRQLAAFSRVRANEANSPSRNRQRPPILHPPPPDASAFTAELAPPGPNTQPLPPPGANPHSPSKGGAHGHGNYSPPYFLEPPPMQMNMKNEMIAEAELHTMLRDMHDSPKVRRPPQGSPKSCEVKAATSYRSRAGGGGGGGGGAEGAQLAPIPQGVMSSMPAASLTPVSPTKPHAVPPLRPGGQNAAGGGAGASNDAWWLWDKQFTSRAMASKQMRMKQATAGRKGAGLAAQRRPSTGF